MDKKFRRVYAAVNNERFDKSTLNALADDTIFVCPVPMFDDIKDRRDLFEHYIGKALDEFDPELDLIADFGDSMIFAMMLFFIGRNYEYVYVARYNRRNANYTVRLVDGESVEWNS